MRDGQEKKAAIYTEEITNFRIFLAGNIGDRTKNYPCLTMLAVIPNTKHEC